jgi:hypothetical protein
MAEWGGQAGRRSGVDSAEWDGFRGVGRISRSGTDMERTGGVGHEDCARGLRTRIAHEDCARRLRRRLRGT